MKQTINIEVPEGKKAVYNEQTQTIEFVDVGPVRSKSWEEFCNNHPENYRNIFASSEDAEGILALTQLTRLRDEWVNGWTPYACNESFIITKVRSFEKFQVAKTTSIMKLLSFPTRRMALEFLHYFKNLIEVADRFI